MRLLAIAAAVAACLALPAAAAASQLIDRSPGGLTLAVNSKGEALLTYRAAGRLRHVLAWGAVNAVQPTRGREQVAFRLDYAGGWGKYHREYWKGFGNACRPYDGPRLGWFVLGCTAPDGSYWAVQSWQRMLPNYGLTPGRAAAAWELHLSHWAGPVPQLSISLDWAYRSYDHIFGTLTYAGKPVYGFRSSPAGVPLDSFGRNLYLDTFNSRYGPGWKRENSFLMHTGTGAFCYGLYSHGGRPAGKGERYRATVIGPGVTPDAFWQGSAPGPYDRRLDSAANNEIRSLGDRLCKPN